MQGTSRHRHSKVSLRQGSIEGAAAYLSAGFGIGAMRIVGDVFGQVTILRLESLNYQFTTQTASETHKSTQIPKTLQSS